MKKKARIEGEVTQVKELENGDLFITVFDYEATSDDLTVDMRYVRRSTGDPFWAETLLGTRIYTYPDEPVYRVVVEEDVKLL